MAGEFFVDTSAWYPLVVRDHPDHARFAKTLGELLARRRRLVTTNLIVAETHALLLRRAGRQPALAFVRTVGQPPSTVARATEDIETRAVDDWLERFADQDFSFADAVSFAVMRERRIRDALTLDQHFVVAGFTAL